MNSLTTKQIQEIIPHRHPFLLVDYIEDFEPGEFGIGYKCVTYREDFFGVEGETLTRYTWDQSWAEALAERLSF